MITNCFQGVALAAKANIVQTARRPVWILRWGNLDFFCASRAQEMFTDLLCHGVKSCFSSCAWCTCAVELQFASSGATKSCQNKSNIMPQSSSSLILCCLLQKRRSIMPKWCQTYSKMREINLASFQKERTLSQNPPNIIAQIKNTSIDISKTHQRYSRINPNVFLSKENICSNDN